MSSIFYKNIITDTYYDTFIKFAATLNKKVALFNNEFSGVTPNISPDGFQVLLMHIVLLIRIIQWFVWPYKIKRVLLWLLSHY